MAITFITSKKEKFREAKALIPHLVQKSIDLPEIQSVDSREVITHKIAEARKHIKGTIIVEDASVELEALNGFPGALAKWMITRLGTQKIYELCKGSRITYRAIIGYWHKNTLTFFEDSVHGKVVKPRGKNGWHWDPLFLPAGSRKTFGEMTLVEKNTFSHRAKAFKRLKRSLEK
ncbi:MAG: non-canonical purine NTP pyrophosphatase [archaeon]